ncbi:hypothetical protein [Halobaculum lipolyticum]|uniref:hypothetical protein n=1 Tax=Halobaculum lipolyticum TaxID=3032001 RepID=UPI0036F2AE24
MTAAGLCGLAGCSGSNESSTEGDPNTGQSASDGPFTAVSIEETALVIDVRDDADVGQVNVIAPDGSRIRSVEVVTGQTRVTVDIGVTYDPGTYEITTDSGESTSITLEPDLVIEELGVGANNLDVMPASLDNLRGHEATVVVRNRGSGPTGIRNLAFGGDVPRSSVELLSTSYRSGIADPEDGDDELDQVVVPAKSSVRLFSNTFPFLVSGGSMECSAEDQGSQAVVLVTSSVSGSTIEESFDISYNSTGDDCTVSVISKRV